MINYCTNIKCFNDGICQPSFLNYTCLCLGDSYSGQYCEITANKIIVHQIISKSFAYVAIIALISVAMFVIIMDILRYCFGIDPIRREIKQKKKTKKKQLKKNASSIPVRFIYVNTPSIWLFEKVISIKKETQNSIGICLINYSMCLNVHVSLFSSRIKYY